jgi:phosphatidylinositol glycan class V
MDDVEMKTYRYPQHDLVTETLLGGCDNWDSEYFIFIAHHGYPFLQTMAFFPLYPCLMWLVGRTLLWPLCFLLADRSLFLVAGTLVNLCVFPLSAAALYLLTLSVSRNQRFSLYAVLLFCINPASVFMSTVYTETLFSFFTFAGLCFLTQRYSWGASLFFSLASATRANGIVLAGFIGYYHLHRLYQNVGISKSLTFRTVKSVGKAVVVCGVQCLVVVLPFLLFQLYSYWKFCHLPASRGEGTYDWCQRSLPLAYSYIQQHYWNVGFLRYYEWKQIPNFLLAFPALWLSLSTLYSTCCGNTGISRGLKGSCFGTLAYAVHLLFLVGFGMLNMHVQVLTRFLFSSTPLLYWFAAGVLCDALPGLPSSPPSSLSLTHLVNLIVTILLPPSGYNQSRSLHKAQLIVLYFLSYVVIGFILHCNFYPWT